MNLNCPIILKHSHLIQQKGKLYTVNLKFLQRLNLCLEKKIPWNQIQKDTYSFYQSDIDCIHSSIAGVVVYLRKNKQSSNDLFTVGFDDKDHPNFLFENSHLVKSTPYFILSELALMAVFMVLFSLTAGTLIFASAIVTSVFLPQVLASPTCDAICTHAVSNIMALPAAVFAVSLATILGLLLAPYLMTKLKKDYKRKNQKFALLATMLFFLTLNFSLVYRHFSEPKIKIVVSLFKQGKLNHQTFRQLKLDKQWRKLAKENDSF